MRSIKKRAHTQDELILVFKRESLDKEFLSAFQDYYNYAYEELFENHKDWVDEDFDDDSIQNMALRLTIRNIKQYVQLIENGHSKYWAHQIADNFDNIENTFNELYYETKDSNPNLAKQELRAYTKLFNSDELFSKRFIYLFEEGHYPINPEESAAIYSKIYKEQIALGKSEIYANEYSWLISTDQYNEIYCEEYSCAYETAINDKKSITYAKEYARRYGHELTDIKRRYGISDDEKMIEFRKDKVIGNMKAWEFAKANNLTKVDRFIEIHEPIYLNSYYPDEAKPDMSIEDFDKVIIDKAILKYKRIED